MDLGQRWIGLRFLAVFATLSVAVCIPLGALAQPIVLDRLVGRDLMKDRPPELADLARLVGKVPRGFLIEPSPWHVWKTDQGGQIRYIVILGEDLMIIPGGTSACVQVFDRAGSMIRSWSFQTGWRIALKDASLEHSAELDGDLIVIRTFPVINGIDITKEFFAIGGDRLRLVRLEDSKGSAVQNEYVFPNSEIGVIPQARTVQEWIDLLQSKDKSDVLSALVFLGGRHISEEERRLLPEPREGKYATLFQELLASPSIHNLIEQLANSNSRWVREAAILAARGPRQRPVR